MNLKQKGNFGVQKPSGEPPRARSIARPLQWVKIPLTSPLGEREVRKVCIEGQVVALALLEGRYGALENACPHKGGALGDGYLDAHNCLHCPWHDWAFDVLTGKGADGADARAYRVQLRGDDLWIEIERSTRRSMTRS